MDEREFMMAADAELTRIEAALETASASGAVDFDFETKPGGVIEIEFENGSKIIVNRHGSLGTWTLAYPHRFLGLAADDLETQNERLWIA